MKAAPIILVPGFWLGAWAWDEVAGLLRADGHVVSALTLPGLELREADRSGVHHADHVAAICAAVSAADAPVVLAVHSAAGFTGYAASDRLAERIAAMVYVDTAPGKGAMDPDFSATEKAVPTLDELRAGENLDGLSGDQLAELLSRGVPEPGNVLREELPLTDDARLDIPSTIIATGYTSEQYREAAGEGYSWLAGIGELRNLGWVDLPTSHWPMWSRPSDLAAIIGAIAEQHAPRSA